MKPWLLATNLMRSKRVETTWMDFLANLFHFKHGSAAYALDPTKWKSVPLYVKNYADNSVVNEVFFYIFSRTVESGVD